MKTAAMTSTLAALLMLTLLGGCGDSAPGPAYEAAGEAVANPPAVAFSVKVGENTYDWPVEGFFIYQQKPATGDAKQAPQSFELACTGASLGGRLTEGLLIAPGTRYADLVGKPLQVRVMGGEPGAPSRSRLKCKDGRVLDVIEGELKVTRAFYQKGKFYGVSGEFTLRVQEMKLADDEKKGSKDETVGEPQTANGSFTSSIESVKYERL